MRSTLFGSWFFLVVCAGLQGCQSEIGANGNDSTSKSGDQIDKIETVVVIYAENRSFDNLYGLFPGANGIPGVNPTSRGNFFPQADRDGAVLPVLPPTWGGMTARGQARVVTQAQSAGLPNQPFQIDDKKGFDLSSSVIGRDLVHRFYNNQMQIDGGKNDLFAAYSDAGGISMGYYDGSGMKMWKIAQQFTLADNFYFAAFGGSFLNHQFLICACAPQYPHADASPARDSISKIDVDRHDRFVRLTPAAGATASVLDGAPKYVRDGNLTPADEQGMFYAVNTMQPPYQPSANAPLATDSSKLLADPSVATTLPPQTQTTIGDLLSAKNIGWAWYAGAWDDTLAQARTGRQFDQPAPNFQFHHQPFNYFANLDPIRHAAYRAEHLRDFDHQFWADAERGALPAVSFYKPQGNLNQHAGYANVAAGDEHIASVIERLQHSKQWAHMLIIVTYDENGGFWDHAAPPQGDQWGPGSRVPTIMVSPYARRGFVDKTFYDTTSVLRFITRRWQLPILHGLEVRDAGLQAHGNPAPGDLTAALDLTLP